MTLDTAAKLDIKTAFDKFSLPNFPSHEMALRPSPIRTTAYRSALAKLQRDEAAGLNLFRAKRLALRPTRKRILASAARMVE
jgi:hypothetical protein